MPGKGMHGDLTLSATSSSTVEEWMIIPSRGGGSAKSLLERASLLGRCGTTRSWACSGRPGGSSAGIGSMRTKICAALPQTRLLRQLGLPLSDIAGELENSSRDLSDTIGRHIGQVNGWRLSAAIASA